MYHLHKNSHTFEDTATKHTRLTDKNLNHSHFHLLLYFLFLSTSISCFACLYPFLHGLSHTFPLLLLLLLHFTSDRGSGLCADCGWLEHSPVRWGSRNLSACALNVPLEQQFPWASVTGPRWGDGSVRVQRSKNCAHFHK